jgi:hypothetical protein
MLGNETMTKTQAKAVSRKRVTQVLRALRSPDQVFTVRSGSGGADHLVTVGTDGKIVCDCVRWRNKRPNDHRHCTHIDDHVVPDNGFRTEVDGDFLYVRR